MKFESSLELSWEVEYITQGDYQAFKTSFYLTVYLNRCPLDVLNRWYQYENCEKHVIYMHEGRLQINKARKVILL